MKTRYFAIGLTLLSMASYGQTRFPLEGDISAAIYMPFPQDIVPDLDATTNKASFGWPEIDVNLYQTVWNINEDRKGIELYAGGSYLNMFGLNEETDGRDFNGSMSTQQFRIGARIGELVRLAYVRTGITASGTSETIFQTIEYGGPTQSQDGYEMGLQAKRGLSSVGLFFRSNLDTKGSADESTVSFQTFEARIQSELLKGEFANGFILLKVGYDNYTYSPGSSSNNRAVDYEGFRVGIGVGVALN